VPKATGPGSYAPGFHEGSRSEYLAQYVFSAFGTCAPVPHQEDHGIDLHCTLVEHEGAQRAWPVAYFSVQVKSKGGRWKDRWTFDPANSVRWLVRYPAPLLLCVVDKKAFQVSIYQTTGRFAIGALERLPKKITLIFGVNGKGRTVGWNPSGNIQLGPPIAEFTVADLNDKKKFALFERVLSFWILNDLENIRRLQTGLQMVKMPGQFETNSVPVAVNATFGVNQAAPANRIKAEQALFELLDWLGEQMFNTDDRCGALLAGLMLRYLSPGGPLPPTVIYQLSQSSWLQALTGAGPTDGLYVSLDQFLADMRSKCAPGASTNSPTTAP
jgi:hypothetical protein